MKFALVLMFCLMSPLMANSTTIAYDGHLMAADSQRTRGDLKFNSGPKITFVPERQAYVGCAGDVASFPEFLKEFALGDDFVTPAGIEVLVVFSNGQPKIYVEGSHHPVDMTAPIAIGSGTVAAMAAMLSGKDATQAIGVAATLDIYTGGKIQVIPVYPVLK